jgi:hypothetical protein
MVPLLPFEETDERKALDKILIFEEPNAAPGRKKVDKQIIPSALIPQTASGTTTKIGRCVRYAQHEGEKCDVQVAEFTSNRINAPQMVGFAACLAAYYGQNTIDSSRLQVRH